MEVAEQWTPWPDGEVDEWKSTGGEASSRHGIYTLLLAAAAKFKKGTHLSQAVITRATLLKVCIIQCLLPAPDALQTSQQGNEGPFS